MYARTEAYISMMILKSTRIEEKRTCIGGTSRKSALGPKKHAGWAANPNNIVCTVPYIPYRRDAEVERSKYVSRRNSGESLAQGEENKMIY